MSPWCVPPRNVRGYLEDMLRRGELKTVNEILMKYGGLHLPGLTPKLAGPPRLAFLI